MTPKCPDCKRDQEDCICASPSSAQEACSPTLTMCPRCHNDVSKCDGVFAAPTPPVSEDQKDAEQAHIAELEQLAHNLGRGLIRWRERTWPGTDQAHVVYREYPALKAIDAAMQEDKP